MTQTAVAYTRGPLSKPTKSQAAGPGLARAGAVQSDLAAHARMREHQASAGFAIVLWRLDDITTPDVAVDRLLGLQQALFLLRADVVDALYVHRRSDLLEEDLATLAAEVKASGRRLIVEGQRVTGPHQVSRAPELIELAEVGYRLREAVAPRLNSRDGLHADEDLDIGSLDTKGDAARLAHKLRAEFTLPLHEVATVLDAASYCYRGVPLCWSKQTADRLIRGAREVISEETLDEAWGAGRTSRLFADLRLRLIYARQGWEGATDGAHVKLEGPDLTGQVAGAPGLDAADRPVLVDVVRLLRSGIVQVLVIPDSRIFGSATIRELVLAEAWACGARTEVDGSPLTNADTCEPGVEHVRRAAGIAARLHRALRVQDRASICIPWDDRVQIAIMQAVDQHPERNLSDRDLADLLNRKVIPTLSGRGSWSHSQARQRRSPET